MRTESHPSAATARQSTQWLARIVLVGVILAISPSSWVVAQFDPNATSLPLPAHPGRSLPAPNLSEPKPAQPKREKKPKQAFVTRVEDRPPVPGHPARNLAPLNDEPEEMEEEEGEEEEPPPGLLLRLPHEFREGGITVEYVYTGESFCNTRGGITTRNATNYRSNFDLVFQVDTKKMGWWENGRFFIYGQNLVGKRLSPNHVGDFQLFSNIDSTISDSARGDYTTVAEYWYEHVFLDNFLRIKLGKQDANADFALSDLGGDFINSSFGMPPMIPLPTFPSQAIGLASFFQLRENVVFGVGIYDGTSPAGPQGVRWGFDTFGQNGAISLYQLEVKNQTGPNNQHPGTLRIGMWHHSDQWTEITTGAARTFNQNYGLWAIADKMIWKESYGDDDEQGLGIFLQFGWAPQDRNFVTEYYGAGLVYKGLFPGRDGDLTGFAIANALVGAPQQIVDGLPFHGETAFELFHKFIFSPYFSLQPDLQYIQHPGAQQRDALVAGARFELVF